MGGEGKRPSGWVWNGGGSFVRVAATMDESIESRVEGHLEQLRVSAMLACDHGCGYQNHTLRGKGAWDWWVCSDCGQQTVPDRCDLEWVHGQARVTRLEQVRKPNYSMSDLLNPAVEGDPPCLCLGLTREDASGAYTGEGERVYLFQVDGQGMVGVDGDRSDYPVQARGVGLWVLRWILRNRAGRVYLGPKLGEVADGSVDRAIEFLELRMEQEKTSMSYKKAKADNEAAKVGRLGGSAVKPGATVMLKSGGPVMTISSRTDDGGYRCLWFDGYGVAQEIKVWEQALVLAEHAKGVPSFGAEPPHAYQKGVRTVDDPDLDGTDAAHPAWWRGEHAGVAGMATQILRALGANPREGAAAFELADDARNLAKLAYQNINTLKKQKRRRFGEFVTDFVICTGIDAADAEAARAEHLAMHGHGRQYLLYHPELKSSWIDALLRQEDLERCYGPAYLKREEALRAQLRLLSQALVDHQERGEGKVDPEVVQSLTEGVNLLRKKLAEGLPTIDLEHAETLEGTLSDLRSALNLPPAPNNEADEADQDVEYVEPWPESDKPWPDPALARTFVDNLPETPPLAETPPLSVRVVPLPEPGVEAVRLDAAPRHDTVQLIDETLDRLEGRAAER